ncbi:hypothetical protein PAEPH01_1347 [Pancytospora epiphaga]|nr:hypothetical protein PAEPH01_1347 [Pancytospora epiphaga]
MVKKTIIMITVVVVSFIGTLCVFGIVAHLKSRWSNNPKRSASKGSGSPTTVASTTHTVKPNPSNLSGSSNSSNLSDSSNSRDYNNSSNFSNPNNLNNLNNSSNLSNPGNLSNSRDYNNFVTDFTKSHGTRNSKKKLPFINFNPKFRRVLSLRGTVNEGFPLKTVKGSVLEKPLRKYIHDTYESVVKDKDVIYDALNNVLTMRFLTSKNVILSDYAILFRLLYSFLRDPNHYIRAVFFDTKGYDDNELFNGINEDYLKYVNIFEQLKTKLDNEGDADKYIEENSDDIIVALKLVLLKHVLRVEKIVVKIIKEITEKDLKSDIEDMNAVRKLFVEYYFNDTIKDLKDFEHKHIFFIMPSEICCFKEIFNFRIFLVNFREINGNSIINGNNLSSCTFIIDDKQPPGFCYDIDCKHLLSEILKKTAETPCENIYAFGINSYYIPVVQ